MNERGSSLLEVLLAVTIMAIATSWIFTVFLSTTGAQSEYSVDTAVETSLASLSSALSRYVSADLSSPAEGPGGSWRLVGDPCPYALAQGCSHDATAGFLDPIIVARHPGAKLTYTVDVDPGTEALRVNMSLQWN